ncbi:TetR family transcriptional regulator [Croceicoccus ponticola]|uniref:TetR family transcriptional regulator n=1 Tax=Croceicoccus ponticola TaxID=2217664 RepID=A0A437GU73_9SPHN|nr:TetR family transcriptional regulator C-terminal domain-containing protein [Croceicoccus ponticola]RVQ64844.1 TetR family transcriptional regulator [Croceicoccus ponticola]
MPIEVDAKERKREVVEAAHALIREGGLSAVTVRSLAARLGCSTTAITHYFANKNEIILASYRHSVERTAQRRRESATAGFAAMLEAILPIGADNWGDWLVYIAFWSEALHDAALRSEQKLRNRSIIAAVDAELSVGAMLPDAVSRAERYEIARAIVATIYGVAVQSIFDPDQWDNEAQRRVLHRALSAYLPAISSA